MCLVKLHQQRQQKRCCCRSYYYVTYVVIFILQFGYSLANTQNCDGDCLKCGKSGCIKCANFIIYPSRNCVSSCPPGFRSRWSHLSEYMGRICIQSDSFLGFSNDTLTILTGITTGTCFCIILIASALLYLSYKRRLLLTMGSEINSDTDNNESPEQRKEFVKQLDTLRPYAHSFLDILNDTRRQLRSSWLRDGASVVAVYKPIVRDLAKILILLNKPLDDITCVPDDWEHLYGWAEKTLRRCKRMSTTSSLSQCDELPFMQPATGQLIEFLQGPSSAENDLPNTNNVTVLSTFKPEQQLFDGGGSSGFFSEGFSNENGDKQWSAFDYFDGHSEFDPGVWKSKVSSRESLHGAYFLQDDDFLGFRPQDEITTEL